MKEFNTIVAPQPTPKTYLKIDSHVHSTIMEHLISLYIAQLSFHKSSRASHKFVIAFNKSIAAKATTKQKVRGSKKSTLPQKAFKF